MEILIVAVLGLIAIAAATALGGRLGVAAPLLLVVVGIGVSLLPFVPEVKIDPEWILAGVLPLLLYSASVSMPTMNFRREFSAIGGLSVVLVVISAVVLGLFFAWVVPGLGIWWGMALGAIVSPTDAVATSIVRRVGVSTRVVSILEGEGLLNDATALVLLRTAVAGAAATVSLGGVLGSFVFDVAVAVIIGYVVGELNLVVRARVQDATANTVISFTVPFLASVPTELLGASGLVAAVAAGLVTGHRAPRVLPPQHRLSDSQNWRTIELVLEGVVFLTIGLELTAVVGDVQADHAGTGMAVAVAAGALVLTVLVRAAYVVPLLAALRARADRSARLKPRIAVVHDRLNAAGGSVTRSDPAWPGGGRRGGRRQPSPGRVDRVRTRLRRTLADIDYLLAAPLGWREGTVVVWAGMRGAVTLAAAQTLPAGTPSRSLLVLIAFLVAVGSLLIQGGTLRRLVAAVGAAGGTDPAVEAAERARVMELLDRAAASLADAAGPPADSSAAEPTEASTKQHTLAVIDAQRQAILDARDDGLFSAETLNAALAVLDAQQIGLELRGGPTG